MRNILTITICLISLSVFGQTTEEEFNYITKGYKIQLASGLDMKKGYEFKAIDGWGINYGSFERKATFKQLFREGETTPCATLMILERTDTDYEEYLCIPHYGSTDEIWNKAYNGFKESAKDWTKASIGYVWGMIKMISYLTSDKN
jgi:hypothetical protein